MKGLEIPKPASAKTKTSGRIFRRTYVTSNRLVLIDYFLQIKYAKNETLFQLKSQHVERKK
jgi:hypothetical protein